MNKELEVLLYNLPEENGNIQVIVKDETLWCTPKAMAQLFGVGIPSPADRQFTKGNAKDFGVALSCTLQPPTSSFSSSSYPR